ncbi:MAG: iron ABC transporter permease [Desulfurococcaceae archaeon]|jgi:iron complex transport system permease protein|nr:iron ABC transporter permease [Desulfurococcaceae archaeon]
MDGVERLFKLRRFFLVVMLVLLFILIPISVSIGTLGNTFLDVFKLLLGVEGVPTEVRTALMLRLRRVLTSVTAGVILGAGGVCMQAVLRNPMASPFTLGISHAAALGVALSLILGFGGVTQYRVVYAYNPYVLPVFAFISSLLQVFIILTLAYRAKLTERALILAAIAMSFFYQAILSLVQYLALNELQVAMVVFWTFGDVGRADWVAVKVMAVVAGVLTTYYIIKSLDLDLISLGDDMAYASGVDPRRLRLEVTLASALGTSVVTAFTGVVAFLCLVAPHIARLVVGSSHRYLIPTSMLVGAILLLVADDVGRTVVSPVFLPAGIVLSLIGAPLLLYLLLRGGG